MLLGDSVYSDLPPVPLDKGYRSVWSDNDGFTSMSSTTPTFTMYDDHEIYNDWSSNGTAADDKALAHAMSYWVPYVGSKNPNRPDGQQYYDFQVGDAAFFVMDTVSAFSFADR